MNNNSNNCGDCGTTCSECGRPWAICKQDGGCGCNKCKDIKFCEYGRMANGCIREKQPGCPMQAVIPSVTVESIEGIKNLADCLVHVSDINTTFYIDDKHRPIITWAGPIDIPGYDMEGNPNNYRDQIVTDVANQMAVIYDKSGKGYMFGLAENIDLQEEINNKLDEMVEDGTLEDIIAHYLNVQVSWTFATVSDLESATNLENGSFAQTLGYYSVNDGGGAKYYIRTKEEGDVSTDYDLVFIGDDLVGELCPQENGSINPLQLGAKGDGITDDSAIIAYAFKYHHLDITKMHKIESQLTNTWQLTITGHDKNSYGTSGFIFDVTGDYGLILNGYTTLEHLTIQGEKALKIVQWNNKIYDCTFLGDENSSTDIAIKFAGTEWFGENIIEHNTFKNYHYAIEALTDVAVATDNYITDNIIIYCDNFIWGVFGATFISRNHDYSYHGIHLYGNDNMINDNYFDNKGNTSIDIANFGSGLSICNNLFLVPTSYVGTTDCINIRDVSSEDMEVGVVCTGNFTGGKRENVTLINFNYKNIYGCFTDNKAPVLFRQTNFKAVLHSKGLIAYPKATATRISDGNQQRIGIKDGVIHLELTMPAGSYNSGDKFNHNLTQIEEDYKFTFYHSTGIGIGTITQAGKISLDYPYSFSDPYINCDIDTKFNSTNYYLVG